MTEMPYKGTRLCIEPRGQGRWPLRDAYNRHDEEDDDDEDDGCHQLCSNSG